MNFIFVLAFLAAVMTFCNLADRQQSGSDTGASNSERSQPAAPARQSLDPEAVKSELLSLANDLTEAAEHGDITFIAQHTTDDFELTDVDGKVQGKNKALADIKEEKSIRSWAITNPELVSVSEDSAVLKYVLSLTLKNGRSGRARITDTYQRKDGRWMLRSEHQTMVK